MMNINTLPDLCLLRVFHYLPLLEQLRLNKVCTRWRSLQLTVTRTRKSLILVVSPVRDDFSSSNLFRNLTCLQFSHHHLVESEERKFTYSTEDCLYFTNFTQNSVEVLIAAFPTLNSLSIIVKMTGFSEMDMFVQLIEHWSPTLTVLQYDSRFQDPYDGSDERNIENEEACAKQIFQFFDCVNANCTQLEVLNFYLYDRLYDLFRIPGYRETHEYVKLDLKFLSWIKVFYFTTFDLAEIIYDSLEQYAAGNDLLESIYLGSDNYFRNFATDFRHLPVLCSKFKSLSSMAPQRDSMEWPNFLSTFTGLTYVSMALSDDLVRFTRYLAPLKHLIHLETNLYFIPEEVGDRTLRDSDELPSYQLHQLPSVKIFSLHVNNPKVDHTETESRHWCWIFPALQVLELDRTGFGEEFQEARTNWNREEAVECLKKLLRPFKQCTGLRYIRTTDHYSPAEWPGEKKEWTLQEFKNI